MVSTTIARSRPKLCPALMQWLHCLSPQPPCQARCWLSPTLVTCCCTTPHCGTGSASTSGPNRVTHCFLAGRGHGYGEAGRNPRRYQRFYSGLEPTGLLYLVRTDSRTFCLLTSMLELFLYSLASAAVLPASFQDQTYWMFLKMIWLLD